MEDAIRPKTCISFTILVFWGAVPTHESYLRSARLDEKIIDMFWTPQIIIGNPRNTKKNQEIALISRLMQLTDNAIHNRQIKLITRACH